jgi:hypothetical protein
MVAKSNITNGKPYTWRHVRTVWGRVSGNRSPKGEYWRWVLSLHNEEQDVKKAIMMIVGACLFLISAAQALPLFFGIS